MTISILLNKKEEEYLKIFDVNINLSDLDNSQIKNLLKILRVFYEHNENVYWLDQIRGFIENKS